MAESYRHIINGHVEYEVEEILAMMPDDTGWPMFLVKWRGYEDETWESMENLSNCSQMVDDFIASCFPMP
jgi:hypothetical protein